MLILYHLRYKSPAHMLKRGWFYFVELTWSQLYWLADYFKVIPGL